jgi:hypothetical protein
VTFTKVCTWIHLLHHSPLPPHSWNNYNNYHFSIYTHVYTVFAPYSPFYMLSPLPPPLLPVVPIPQIRPVLPSYSLIFEKEKKWHFCLFKVATQGVSLWHFHVYIYYNLNWFIYIFLLSTLVPFYDCWTGLEILYSFLYRNTQIVLFLRRNFTLLFHKVLTSAPAFCLCTF